MTFELDKKEQNRIIKKKDLIENGRFTFTSPFPPPPFFLPPLTQCSTPTSRIPQKESQIIAMHKKHAYKISEECPQEP